MIFFGYRHVLYIYRLNRRMTWNDVFNYSCEVAWFVLMVNFSRFCLLCSQTFGHKANKNGTIEQK